MAKGRISRGPRTRETYALRQRKAYLTQIDGAARIAEGHGHQIAGRWEENENYPYAQHLTERFTKVDREYTKLNGRCLDFGCGNGRMLTRFDDIFRQLDGCDLNPEFLDAAKRYIFQHTELFDQRRIHLYMTDGESGKLTDRLGAAAPQQNYYDFIFSTIVLIHIIPVSVRLQILKDHYNLLTPNGKLCHQMIFCETESEIRFGNVAWTEEDFDTCTGGANVVIVRKELPIIKASLEEIGFKNVEFVFKPSPNYPPRPIPQGMNCHEGKYGNCQWIYIHATK
jgi:SAM-dependent methyltransferase